MGTLHKLTTLEGKVDFPGERPTITFERLGAERESQTSLFLQRYYEESRALILGEKEMKVTYNPAEKFKANMKLYKSYLSDKNKEEVASYYQTLSSLK